MRFGLRSVRTTPIHLYYSSFGQKEKRRKGFPTLTVLLLHFPAESAKRLSAVVCHIAPGEVVSSNDWHERYTAFKEASKGQSQLIKEIQGRFVQRYWRVNRDTIAHEVWTKHRHVLGDERVANIEAQLKQYLAENQEVLKKIELRSKIYKEYDKEYNKYFRGTKL